LFCCFR